MLTPQPVDFQTQVPVNVSMTDPLAVQYLTQGQMGYMPQAQYLTPAEYGSFRTLPPPPQYNFLQQDTGFLQSWLIRNYGGPLGLPKYTFNTYNPAVNQVLYMDQMNRQTQDQLRAGLATTLNFGANMGVTSYIGGLLGGFPGFILGGAVGSLLPDFSAPYTDRIRDMRAIQNLTMSKITGGLDVNPNTGMGFNAASARSMDSFLRLSAADDVVLKEGDWRKLFQLGIEYGQFDYANNAQQYKDILKKMRGALSTVMEVIGSTDFKDIMAEFKRMQSMGASITEYQRIARKENIFARMAGLSHKDMVDTYGQHGALLFQQSGLTGYQGSLAAMSNAATVTMGQRLGLIDPGTLSRYGGVSGLTQTMTQTEAQGYTNAMDKILPYFLNKDATGFDPTKTLEGLLEKRDPLQHLIAGADKLNNQETMANYLQNRSKLYQQLIDTYGEDIKFVLANEYGKKLNFRGRRATDAGLVNLGFAQNLETAHIDSQKVYDDNYRANMERNRYEERRKKREEEDLANNPFRKLARSIDKMLTRAGEGLFGSMVGEYAGWQERNAFAKTGITENPTLSRADLYARAEASRAAMAGGGSAYTYNGSADANIPNNEYLGALAAKFESGKKGSADVSYDKGGGTSYGLFNFSSTNGIVQDFQKFIGEKAKSDTEAASIFQQINEGGGFKNTGNKDITQGSGKLWVDLATGQYANKFADLQKQFFTQRYYTEPLRHLDAIPELRKMIEGSRTLQQVFASATNHTGESAGGGARFFMEAWKEGAREPESLLRAVYRKRLNWFRKSNPAYSNNNRYNMDAEGETEAKAAMDMLRQERTPVSGIGAARGDLQDLDSIIGDRTEWGRKQHIAYSQEGPRESIKRSNDCSGWADELLGLMADARDEQGNLLFEEHSRTVMKGLKESKANSERIFTALKDAAKGYYTGNDLDPKNIRGGMIVTIDTGITDFDRGREFGTDHVGITYEKNGEVYVSEISSANKNDSVRDLKYSEWHAQMVARGAKKAAKGEGTGRDRKGGTIFRAVDTRDLMTAEQRNKRKQNYEKRSEDTKERLRKEEEYNKAVNSTAAELLKTQSDINNYQVIDLGAGQFTWTKSGSGANPFDEELLFTRYTGTKGVDVEKELTDDIQKTLDKEGISGDAGGIVTKLYSAMGTTEFLAGDLENETNKNALLTKIVKKALPEKEYGAIADKILSNKYLGIKILAKAMQLQGNSDEIYKEAYAQHKLHFENNTQETIDKLLQMNYKNNASFLDVYFPKEFRSGKLDSSTIKDVNSVLSFRPLTLFYAGKHGDSKKSKEAFIAEMQKDYKLDRDTAEKLYDYDKNMPSLFDTIKNTEFGKLFKNKEDFDARIDEMRESIIKDTFISDMQRMFQLSEEDARKIYDYDKNKPETFDAVKNTEFFKSYNGDINAFDKFVTSRKNVIFSRIMQRQYGLDESTSAKLYNYDKNNQTLLDVIKNTELGKSFKTKDELNSFLEVKRSGGTKAAFIREMQQKYHLDKDTAEKLYSKNELFYNDIKDTEFGKLFKNQEDFDKRMLIARTGVDEAYKNNPEKFRTLVDKRLLEDYEKGVSGNGWVTQQELQLHAALSVMGVKEYMRKYGPEGLGIIGSEKELLTVAGQKKILEFGEKNKMVPLREVTKSNEAIKRAEKEGRTTINASDLALFPEEAKLYTKDMHTAEAVADKARDKVADQLREEQNRISRHNDLLERQMRGGPNGPADGYVTNDTLHKLAEALKELTTYLQKVNGGKPDDTSAASRQDQHRRQLSSTINLPQTNQNRTYTG